MSTGGIFIGASVVNFAEATAQPGEILRRMLALPLPKMQGQAAGKTPHFV